MTDRDFFAAMAVGIPPLTPPAGPAPIWIGVDLANGRDMTVAAEVAADGTITRMTTFPQEQSNG